MKQTVTKLIEHPAVNHCKDVLNRSHWKRIIIYAVLGTIGVVYTNAYGFENHKLADKGSELLLLAVAEWVVKLGGE